MEEDVGAKAPVTRLRRRLSVEQSEEVKSPSTPSTPGKKRGGRLAAKPQLELIDENAPENAPKRQTKKTAAKDAVEASEEKVLTPSRRSTRIKSNTSIVSDTPQSFDSPRAKRAARRNSQIGSDNEAPLTPVRQTRRTRKDSTSSNDKPDIATSAKKATIIAHSIIEEVESNNQKSKENEKAENSPKRKSPRLLKKTKQGDEDIGNEDLRQRNNIRPDTNEASKNQTGRDDSFKLINSLEEQPVNKTHLNNSASSVNSKKIKRNRTNTWPAVLNSDDNSDIKADDIDNTNKNKDKLSTSNEMHSNETEKESRDLFNLSSNNKKRNSVSSNNSKLDSILLDKSSSEKLQFNNSGHTSNNNVLNETEKLFEKAPVTAVQSIIYFEDSDTDSRGKPASDKPMTENEDQCVPVIPEINQNQTQSSILNINENASDKISYNDTCEPMDIDETMPTNVSLINSSNSNQDKDVEKSILESAQVKLTKSPNKSKRESTSSLSTSQNNDKTGSENKSTLILSQLKDVSTNDNSLTKSPKVEVEALSKSVIEIKKDNSNKDSPDYMTSTPLQQKNLKKMTIKINTSVINSSNSVQQPSAKKNNDSKQLSTAADHSSEEESDPEHVSTKEKSDFLDDEAEEASDDYESGDSQDEEERQYEKENEIQEKGETLDSGDDASYDTDYEKDSFVVSSDEEDNDLLSGSGDDLSMSDKELSMSKKSKKKFDERKLKEQKKASREMYEARHNISNDSSVAEFTKHKKNKRQRINSSTLVSEEEVLVKTKKSRKMKLDSSQDSSTGDIEAESKEPENNVSLSNEHEITSICDESIMNKKDPLSMKVKIEPQTPLKDLNMSTVPILDKIEEVQMSQNVSIMKANETSDPLQEDSEASSISENMEISSNYDSILKELNKEVKNKKMESLDMSLNLNKKTKQNAKEPIVDNLNLTTTKKLKHNTNTDILKNANKETKINIALDESSSDSIDLQLLFSEDSSDSIKKDSEYKQKQPNEPESFIPLKRTEAKTNIPEDFNLNNSLKHQDMDTSANHSQDTLNTSSKKKNKNRISMGEETREREVSDTNLTRSNLELSINNTLNISGNKKKKKNSLSVSENCGVNESRDEEIAQNKTDHNQSMNTSIKKKKKKNSMSVSEETELTSNVDNVEHNLQHVSKDQIDHDINDMSVNTPLNTSSKKKKKHSLTTIDIELNQNNQTELSSIIQNNLEKSMNSTLNTSSKKKRNKNSVSISVDTDNVNDVINKNSDISVNNSYLDMSSSIALNTSSKKKKTNGISGDIDSGNKLSGINNIQDGSNALDKSTNEVTDSSKKKKRNDSVVANLSLAVDVDDKVNDSLNTSTKKKKKAKSMELQESVKDSQDGDSDAPEEIPYESHKNTSAGDHSDGVHMFIDTEGNQDWNTLITSGSSKKKNKKKKRVQETPTQINEIVSSETNYEEPDKSKKRKRKLSANSTLQETVTADQIPFDESVNMGNKKKKQKKSQSEEIPVEIKETTKKQSKKRKDRDDDDAEKTSKVFKQNSYDKLSVPRLPSAVLDQLEDKPKKEVLEKKKAKLVSTTQFIVEEAKKRKNKPSNYLEKSVSLNDSVDEKKQKGFIKIPQVLPSVATATISGRGFTTKFQINVLPKETKFVAQTSNMTGFKNEYLGGRKIKKVGTYELYKSQRNKKMSKF